LYIIVDALMGDVQSVVGGNKMARLDTSRRVNPWKLGLKMRNGVQEKSKQAVL